MILAMIETARGGHGRNEDPFRRTVLTMRQYPPFESQICGQEQTLRTFPQKEGKLS